MHVAAVVAPAGGLSVDVTRDGVVEAVPHLDHALLAKQSVLGQQLLGATQVAAGEVVVTQQVLEDARGEGVAVVLREHVLTGTLEDNLRVPAEEAETLAVLAPAADGVPVVVVPVGVAAILVDKHIVNEGVHVEQRVQLLVGRLVGGGAGGRLNHQLPGVECALGSFDVVAAVLLNLDHVDVALLAAQVVLAELFVHTLGHVVESPVHTIKK